MTSPILSIVVPTKNRYEYLKHLVDLISTFACNELEFVIQDNSDDNSEFLEYLKIKSGKFIKYFYEKTSLTSVENFDKAILNSNGEFVCFIGDDDGVMRYILDCVKWMKKNNIEALRSSHAHYFYDKQSTKGRSINKKLEFTKPKLFYHFLNPIYALKRLLKNGCELKYIPTLYNGIVKRDVLDKIYENLGTFFPGASADIANGVALCFYLRSYVIVDFPVIIGGSSVHTGGGVRLNKNYCIDNVPFISDNSKKEWEGHIPRLWYGSLVWEESSVKALRALNKETLISCINHDLVIARFQSSYKNLVTGINKICKYYSISYCKVQLLRLKLWIENIIKGGVNHFFMLLYRKKRSFQHRYLYNVKDIVDAENKLYSILKTNMNSNNYEKFYKTVF